MAMAITLATAEALIIAYVVKRHLQARAASVAKWEASIAKLIGKLFSREKRGKQRQHDWRQHTQRQHRQVDRTEQHKKRTHGADHS